MINNDEVENMVICVKLGSKHSPNELSLSGNHMAKLLVNLTPGQSSLYSQSYVH